MAAIALATPQTLFDLEERLEALTNSVETVTPDQEQEFLLEFKAALTGAVEKRDRVAGMLSRLENQQAYAAAEIKRLQEFKKAKEADQARLENYVSYCIDSMGRDAKGKYKKLEGNSTTMFLRACPASVEITDEAAVPLNFKRTTVTLPAPLMDTLFRALDPELLETAIAAAGPGGFSVDVDKRTLKGALEAGTVAGAKLITDKTSLGRK